MREIGSEFWDVPIKDKNNLFPKCAQWYLSGRSALQAIIRELKDCRSIAMPSWCCESMIKPFIDAGINVHFYSSCPDQKPRYDCDALYLMDYFGYTSSISISSVYRGIIIRDITHSILSTLYSDADYYFGSLRKWCGVWTGGYAWSSDGKKIADPSNNEIEYALLRKQAMELKEKYINGEIKEKKHLEIFNMAENVLESVEIGSASERDIHLAEMLDVKFIRAIRRENAEVLRKAFSSWLIFPKMELTDCPMFVPVLIPNGKRDELKRYLNDQRIYSPNLWPMSRYHQLTEDEKSFYDNELSLVCDQRYSVEDMKRIVRTIKNFWEA